MKVSNISQFLEKISIDFLQKNYIYPENFSDKDITCLVSKDTPIDSIEYIRVKLNKDIYILEVESKEIEDKISKLLQQQVKKEYNKLDKDTEYIDILEVKEDNPAVKIVSNILIQAIRYKASDIHIEPYEKELVIRIRVDGILHPIMTVPESYRDSITARIKVISKMDIAEKRLPQDGRLDIKFKNLKFDVRVSTIPTLYGERLVLRLLNKSAKLLTLDQLGLIGDNKEQFLKLIKKPYGIILITGPTGAGKSTTLYSILNELNNSERNILTIEDPVEYQIKGIGQIQVKPEIGLTFAKGLRHILRQDPDIIMIGEIRDKETAEIAVHSALTGHLVLSTVHTNDAPSAITRLVDMGIEPFLISSSLQGVIAQRLVRRICENCKISYKKDNLYNINILYKGKGCKECLNTGYKGRIGIFEVLTITSNIQRTILTSYDSKDILKVAKKEGFKTLFEDGLMKVKKGFTTLDELYRSVFV